MPDLIPPDAAAPGAAAPGASPAPAQEEPRAIGTPQAAADSPDFDPSVEQPVSPDEQAELDQFISRFTLILSDTGKGGQGAPNTPSPHEAIIADLNNAKVPLAEAIGRTTANIAFMIVQQAQVSKVTYSPEVLFHACFECCALVYITGNAAGIFKGVPKFRGLTADGEYDFNEFEFKLLTSAQMQAVRAFGNMELKAGMISRDVRQQNMDFWQQQVRREMASGTVNQDVLDKLSASGLFDKRGSSDPTGEGPQSAYPAPAQPEQPQPGLTDAPTPGGP